MKKNKELNYNKQYDKKKKYFKKHTIKPKQITKPQKNISQKLKNKILNHIMINGNKKTSEQLLLNCFKEVQKETKKNSKKLLQLAIVNAMPAYKLLVRRNKKNKRKKQITEIPSFIRTLDIRNSLVIKQLLLNIKNKKKLNGFKKKFQQELVSLATKYENEILVKNTTQEKIEHIVKEKKIFLKRFRW